MNITEEIFLKSQQQSHHWEKRARELEAENATLQNMKDTKQGLSRGLEVKLLRECENVIEIFHELNSYGYVKHAKDLHPRAAELLTRLSTILGKE